MSEVISVDLQRIGTFLSVLRKEQGLPQEQLGEKLGVTNKTVSRWETGTYLPPVEILQSLSALYGVSINELLSGQRLSEQQYIAFAEENMKSVIRTSSFSLKEKMAFYKDKWKREHRFELAAAVAAAIVLLLCGLFGKGWLSAAAALWISGYLVHRNNRMMSYVEDRAFDGSGNQ